MVLIRIMKEWRKTTNMHGYCKTAPNHHSLTLTGLREGDLAVSKSFSKDFTSGFYQKELQLSLFMMYYIVQLFYTHQY